MLALWRSAPVAVALMKAVVVETLNHGGSFGRRQNDDGRSRFIRHDQWQRRQSGCNRGFVLAVSSHFRLSHYLGPD
jgi:hypothetical protein